MFTPTLARAIVITLCLADTSAGAQPGGPPRRGTRPAFGMMAGAPGRGGAGPVAATADFLLAHTGELSLTDAQVVRLAAISRRTDARRKAIIAHLDSARAAERPAPADSAGRPGRGRGLGGPPPAEMQQAREQMRLDVRDAIAVLTADQQATAWMMVAGAPTLGGMPGGPMGPRPGRRAEGRQRFNRGPISRPPAPRDVPRRPESPESTEP